MAEAAEYFCKDFEWSDLKARVERDSDLRYHLVPFEPSESVPPLPPVISFQEEADSEAWKRFHRRHSSGKFFKERRYLLKEFPELVSCKKFSKVLEVGCGNGSTALPILRGNENIIVYACDCSVDTLERAKEIINSAAITSVQNRFHPFFCDFSRSQFPTWLACNNCREILLRKPLICSSGVDGDEEVEPGIMVSSEGRRCCIGGVEFVTLIFTLSAISPQKLPSSIKELFSILKPGGLLLFRDYGLYDMAMLRFKPNQIVGFREYMRVDGTRSYFFSLETVRDLFVSQGFNELELDYCCVKSSNRRNGKHMERVWIHGKFQKPS